MKERLQVVDNNDNPIRIATREEAWANGWILRHVNIVLRDKEGNFLMQQRSVHKKAHPGKWTWAATGHVDAGETYESAAPRELYEEIGIKDVELTRVGKTRIKDEIPYGVVDCFTTVFSGTIDKDTQITVDPEEVETTQWLSLDELRALAQLDDKLTPKCRAVFLEFFS